MFLKSSKKLNKGFSIIEVLVAISVILVSFTAALNLINRSMAFHDLAYSRLVASYLAQEGIEIVRNIRDNNFIVNQPDRPWDDGLEPGEYQVQYDDLSLRSYTREREPLNLDTTTGLYNYEPSSPTNVPTRYTRKIVIEKISDNHIRVQSIVSWSNRGGNFQIIVEDHLYNWL
jgi:prepilin-type N-terminal cleavage/methylation domain-containing protein